MVQLCTRVLAASKSVHIDKELEEGEIDHVLTASKYEDKSVMMSGHH